jgi:hypothetical protein
MFRLLSGQSSFAGVDTIKDGCDIAAPGLVSDFLDSGRHPVTPADFFGEGIPDCVAFR